MSSAFEILIVEDSDSKLISILGVVQRVLPNAMVRTAFSVSSGIESIQGSVPDMLIVDMSLPTYDIDSREPGGSPRTFGGIEIFDILERDEILVPVLVVTSYPVLTDGGKTLGLAELTTQLRSDYPTVFLGTVYFDSSFSAWEREIESHLEKVARDKYGS